MQKSRNLVLQILPGKTKSYSGLYEAGLTPAIKALTSKPKTENRPSLCNLLSNSVCKLNFSSNSGLERIEIFEHGLIQDITAYNCEI